MRFHPQNLEIGQEKLVRALEQEFAIKIEHLYEQLSSTAKY